MGLIVDNFAGGGGASLGISMGLDRPIDIAINHDPEAIAMHVLNHPDTTHYCENIWEIDPKKITSGIPVDLCWLSPDCKHFSVAKGGKPVNKKIRALAWVAQKWAGTVRPDVIILENVREFMTWGPLVAKRDKETGRVLKVDGTVALPGEHVPINEQHLIADKKHKGRTFKLFIESLKEIGYEVEWRELRACDFGAPTIRNRFFLIARCDGNPIVWPEATHGNGKEKPYRSAAECIDWEITCPSIFDRKRPLADATLRRIAKGVMRYVVQNDNPFIVNCGSSAVNLISYYGDKKEGDFRGGSVDSPLATQTTENRHALVEAFLAKHYTGITGSDLKAPIGTVTSVDHHSLVAAHIVRQFGQSIGSACDEPTGTVTAGGNGKTLLAASSIARLKGTCRDGQDITEPLRTINSQGTHFAEVRSFLIKYYGNETEAVSIDEPMHTITSKDRMGVVMVKGQEYVIVDIGMRMLQPRELYRAQGFPDTYKIDPVIRGKKLSKSGQVRMAGNSVPPNLAQALVQANITTACVGKERVA